MPYVNIRLTGDPVTDDRKNAMIKGAAEQLHDVPGKDSEKTFDVVAEIPMDNRGVGGQSVASRRSRVK